MNNNVFSEFTTNQMTYNPIYSNIINKQSDLITTPPPCTNLDHNINDTFIKSEAKNDFSADDGKISFKDKLKNFAKGLVSPITTMFTSPKNFAIGAASLAGVSLLVAATGGAITPLLIASGVTMGGIQIAKSAYNAASAATDDQARQAWQGIGAGTTAVAGSIAGAKGALKASGVDTTNMSAFEATLQCFKNIPSSIGKSFNAFRTGAALTNIKNAFGINKKKNNETKTDNKSYEEPENIKNETKSETKQPEVKAEQKPEAKADTKQPETKSKVKTEAKIETQQEVKAEQKPEVKADTKQPETKSEVKTEAKIETQQEIKAEQKPEVKADTKQPETKSEVKTEAKIETQQDVKAEQKTEVVQQDISAEGQSVYSKKLASLSEEETAAFKRAKNILDSQGIEYSDEELLMYDDAWKFGCLDESLTSNGSAYGHGGAYGINYKLRDAAEGCIPKDIELKCKILDKGIKNLPPLEQNETVYRGVHGNRFMKKNLEFVKSLINAKEGEVISDKGYSYASFSKEITNRYADTSNFNDFGTQAARMKIIVPKGSKVSIGGHQQEMLFPRNAQFEVVEQAKMAEDGIMEIVLKYILPKD